MKKKTIGKKPAKSIIPICAAVLSVAICVTTVFGFIAKKESYEQKKSSQSVEISKLSAQLDEYRQVVVKNNGELDKKNAELETLNAKLDKVKTQANLQNNYNNTKVAYLTFDDGPSKNTLEILKVLKKYNIKATFFVTAQNLDCIDYLKQVAADGHTIGLHTYSHDYKKIYSSTDEYFKDLQKIHDLVKKTTGVDARVMRFPGGSSNTISEKYSNGIMTRLTKMVVDKGYSYFDWNCDSTDAEYRNDTGRGRPVNDLINGTINSAGKQQHICVLMHDTWAKQTTADALPKIIEQLKSKGYSFDKLTVDTPADDFRHHVNN